MAPRLHYHLLDRYDPKRHRAALNGQPVTPVQVDDQTDTDNINQFCTVFATAQGRSDVLVEIAGPLPITPEIELLATAHDGTVDKTRGRVSLKVACAEPSPLTDLARLIRATGVNGCAVSHPQWVPLASRTADSVTRLEQALREFRN